MYVLNMLDVAFDAVVGCLEKKQMKTRRAVDWIAEGCST